MGRGKQLKKAEAEIILNMRKKGLSLSKISKLVNRSPNVIRNLLKDPNNYGKKKSKGRASVTSVREKHAILKIASNSTLTARQIASEAGVSTNVRNVQRILKQSKNIQRRRLQRKPPLTKKHIDNRMKFAREHLRWRKKWKRVMFSDEKRFTLDGPDSWSYYFHDLRKDPRYQIRRQMGGGGIMVWGAIGYKGKTNIRFINSTMKSIDYIKLIDEEIKLHATRITGNKFIFQQDNAAVHTAKVVNNYFCTNNIKVLPWPAKSPDLNIIENVWGYLTRQVYAGGKQFHSLKELKVMIEEACGILFQEN